MARTVAVVAVVTAAAAAGAALLLMGRGDEGMEEVGPEYGVPPPQPAAPDAVLGKVPSLADIKGAVAAGALSPLATVGLGVGMLNALGAVGTAVGGQGTGDVVNSGLGGLSLAGGAIIGKLGERLAGGLGATEGQARTAGLLTGAGVVLGAPGVLAVGTAKAVGEGASWLIGKAFGDSAEDAVRGVAREFDPFRTGSVANAPVRAVSGVVKGVGKVLGSIF